MTRNTRSTRLSAALLAASVLIVTAPSALLAQGMPADVVEMYEGMRVAIEVEDIESMIGYFTPLAVLQAQLGEGWLKDVSGMFGKREEIAADEAFGETQERADILVKREGAWQILGSDLIDTEALETLVTGQTYSDPRAGLTLTAPDDWRLIPFGASGRGVVAYSPDLTAMIVWFAVDLPGTFSAQQMASSSEEILKNIGPSVGLSTKDSQAGDATLAGRDAYHSSHVLVDAAGMEIFIDRIYCVVGQTAYVVAQNAIPPAGYAAHKDALDRALASTQIVAPEIAELPPEAGRVEDGQYINDTYGCSIDIPEGWDAKIGTGQWNIQLSMRQPGGDSFMTLGMIDLPAPEMTAEAAVMGDVNVAAQVMESHAVIRQGDTMVGELPAYESLTKFDMGETSRQRYRVYLVDGDHLFFVFADAVPADSYDRLQPILDKAAQSLKIYDPPEAPGE